MAPNSLVVPERIEQKIYLIRGERIMLDADLADLYGVETFNLNKAVKRNTERFSPHFMFQLMGPEFHTLKHAQLQKAAWGGRRTPPYAFTEQGVAMLSSVLRSKQAIQVNIAIMDTFVKLRRMTASHRTLASKLNMLEKKYDQQFKAVFDAIRQLMEPPAHNVRRPIGFQIEKKQK